MPHQQGDTIPLSTDDPVKFSAVNSQRLRFGGRLTGDYAGAPASANLALFGSLAGIFRLTSVCRATPEPARVVPPV